MHLFVLGVHLHIRRCLSVLKKQEPHFSGLWLWFSMISNRLLKSFWMTLLLIVTHCRMGMHHSYHLRLLFERCHHYLVRLNPHKCIFCVKSGCLLGFIVSKEGIRVDPLKVEEILQLSPPRNIRHLQCLQGMENFLRRFVMNFANLTRGFTCLLKKDTTFC